MADATPSRLGQIGASGDVLALFLKVFSGETLTAFDRESAFRDRHMTRTIPSGKSAQFPVTGRASASYHTPGEEILGSAIQHGERIIAIEDLLIAPIFVSNFDEMMNHYDVRSIYSNEIGEKLARVYDQDVARTFILAARAGANLAELPAGTTVNNANFDTDGTVLYGGIFDAGVTLDANDIPQQGRNAFVRPVQYALVVRSEKPIDRDLNPQDNGSLAEGFVRRINAIPLVKTNNLPSTNQSLDTAIPAKRRADYSPTQAVVAHENAVGTVQLQDLTMEQEYDMRRQGHLMLGKYLVGHDYLRPEAAVELRTADPA